jgi:uncharacterized membrane protein YfcA
VSPLLGIATAGVGVVVGVTSALFGVGGGILMVPFMVLALEMTQHVAEGTSLLVIVPTALVGTIAHSRRGYVDRRAAAGLAAGGIVGALIGALVSLELPGDTLQRMFAVVAAIAGARLIYDGIKGRESGSSASPSPRER